MLRGKGKTKPKMMGKSVNVVEKGKKKGNQKDKNVKEKERMMVGEKVIGGLAILQLVVVGPQ